MSTVKPNSSTRKIGLLTFGLAIAESLRQIGRIRTADTYKAAINSFARFTNNIDIPIYKIDTNIVAQYQNYLCAGGICHNTLSFYMRNLRAIYNRAVHANIVAQRKPFEHVYTGVEKTAKRAITSTSVRKIRDLDTAGNTSKEFARDMFMFSFYARGMSFVDMAYLLKSDLRSGIIFYRRRKTGQYLAIKCERPLISLISKYNAPDSPYLLPILAAQATPDQQRHRYLTVYNRVNYHLHNIGRQLAIPHPLTTYVARHAWASIARDKNIAMSVISQAMGHESEATTRIYLAALDSSLIDKANRLIITSL